MSRRLSWYRIAVFLAGITFGIGIYADSYLKTNVPALRHPIESLKTLF